MAESLSLFSTLRFNFLYVDRYSFTSTWAYPSTVVPYSLLRYILCGEAIFAINGHEFRVGKGDVVYIPEGATLDCRTWVDDFEFISIRFVTAVHLRDGDLLAEYFGVRAVTHTTQPIVLEYFNEVYKAAISKNKSRMFRIRGNLELILAHLSEQEQSGETAPENGEPLAQFSEEKLRGRVRNTYHIKRDPRVELVVDYLIDHPTEPFNTEYLCNLSELSPSSLRRLFKQHTGKSPGEFTKELKMMAAARRLLVTDERVSTIAYEIGFEDPNYFARAFKQIFGVSPAEYRKVSRE